jgi:outer membrane protein TolC
LLRRRPDVREAERKLAGSTARIGVATGALFPTVSIGASAGLTGVLEDLGTQPTARWGFGPLISWSFPANGQRGRIQEAQYGADAALAQFDGVVLKALRETQSSLATYAADYTRADALTAAQKSAAESADQTHRFFLAGRESFIADLDATRVLTTTNSQLAAARGQVALDQVNLFLALGGGWEMDSPPEQAKAAAAPVAASASTPSQ